MAAIATRADNYYVLSTDWNEVVNAINGTPQTITTTGAQTALALPSGNGPKVVRLDNATALTIQGIVAGYDGQIIIYMSTGAGTVSFVNQSGSATAANRIILGGPSDITLAAGVGRVMVVYDATTARWRVLESFTLGTYTPTLTNVSLGNGSVTGTYIKIGKWFWFTVKLIWGTTTSASGSVGFSFPFTAASSTDSPPMANGYALDVGVASYIVTGQIGSTTRMDVFALNTSGTYATRDFVNATVPFTWGSTDQLQLAGFLEAAA